jgi:hypothetical protein
MDDAGKKETRESEMTRLECILGKTLEEYETVFDIDKRGDAVEWGEVQARLERELSWTPEGACEIARLAREYGAFMLRNALAVAKVLGIEDGGFGY